MKETRTYCDFCGRPIVFVDYDYQPNFRIKVQRYKYDIYSKKKWRYLDVCAGCQHIIYKWLKRGDK